MELNVIEKDALTFLDTVFKNSNVDQAPQDSPHWNFNKDFLMHCAVALPFGLDV